MPLLIDNRNLKYTRFIREIQNAEVWHSIKVFVSGFPYRKNLYFSTGFSKLSILEFCLKPIKLSSICSILTHLQWSYLLFLEGWFISWARVGLIFFRKLASLFRDNHILNKSSETMTTSV